MFRLCRQARVRVQGRVQDISDIRQPTAGAKCSLEPSRRWQSGVGRCTTDAYAYAGPPGVMVLELDACGAVGALDATMELGAFAMATVRRGSLWVSWPVCRVWRVTAASRTSGLGIWRPRATGLDLRDSLARRGAALVGPQPILQAHTTGQLSSYAYAEPSTHLWPTWSQIRRQRDSSKMCSERRTAFLRRGPYVGGLAVPYVQDCDEPRRRGATLEVVPHFKGEPLLFVARF